MSKHTPHAHIAGEVVASGSRPANEVATRIIERLAADGYRIVPAHQAGALEVLIDLDRSFDLSGVESARVFLDALRSLADQPVPADRAA